MWNFLGKVNRNLVLAIPAMMAAGFLFGLAADPAPLKQLIVPLTFLMVYPMMVTLNVRKVLEGGDARAQLLTQAINFAVVPFVTYGLGLLFFKDQPYMALGLLLAGLVPTSGMTISWTGFAKGNLEAAVKMTVVGLTLGSIATPFYVRLLMGAEIEVDTATVLRQIAVIVFVPMIAGYLTRQGLIRRYGQKGFQQEWAPRFPAMSTVGVLGIVFVAIALKSAAIVSSPGLLVKILVPLLILYPFNYALSTFAGKMLLPRGDAIALVYGSVMRNLSIALAIAINAFGAEGSSAALVIAVSYIVQVQSAAWYVKLTDRVFGPPAPAPAAAPAVAAPVAPPAAAAEKPVPPPAEAPAVPVFRKILYATDLSETARHAIRYACGIGVRHQADITVLHVVPDALKQYSDGAGSDLSARAGDKGGREYNAKEIEAADDAVRRRMRETAAEIGRSFPFCPLSKEDVVVRVGDPAEEIVSMAREGDYDLVIMGTHGHGKLEGLMIGSVAEGVVRRCAKPVLVVRLPDAPVQGDGGSDGGNDAGGSSAVTPAGTSFSGTGRS